MKQPPLEVESLRILINRRSRRALDDARRQPLREGFFRRAVTIRFPAKFEPHDVVRTAFVQLFLTRGADQIVRRRHDARRFAGNLTIIDQRAKWLDALDERAHFSASPASA